MAFYGREEIFEFRDFAGRDSIGCPNYNNFWMYFVRDWDFSFVYRKKDFFMKFLENYPELDEELVCDMVNVISSNNRINALLPYEKKLYEAYLLMRKEYGASNKDCFT